ncbi:albusnodin family lasso peptide [Streptomyces sp. NPDC090442]
MTDHEQTATQQQASTFTPPQVIDLGDAAELTRGSDQDSTESKQTPYD